jgi:RNA polymerase sigma factor for flagellar operon FliA
LTVEVWNKYQQTGDPETRDALIRKYLPLVKQVAGRLSMGLPSQVEEDDLIASGVIGLLEALDRFNPSFNTTFKTYATWRIRGAMLDELRKLSWSPRSFSQRLRQLQAVEQKLGHSLGREPSIAELAAELDWTPSAVEQLYAQVNYYSLVSLESLLFTPSLLASEAGGGDPLSFAGPFILPEDSVEKKERQELLAKAIEELSEREKLILSLYYKEELTLKEIGSLLKVSIARVSQIHAKTLQKLRIKLKNWGFGEG